MSLKWLYLDLNSYFASVEQQLHPTLRNRPVAVVPSLTDSTCAIAASYEAKAYGIKTGTKIYEAKRMCPDLILVCGNHQHYVEYHHRILKEIDKYIPVDQICSIDEVACKLVGRECNEDYALDLARRIKQGIRQNVGECLRCSIGIAPNKFLAKTASNLEKPNGLQIIYAEDMPGRISHFKLRDLTGIGQGVEYRLHRAGIFTIEQLFTLSPKHMRKIWGGVGGERYWYMLRGHQLPDVETTRSSIGHSHILEPNLRPEKKARQVMKRLLLKAASRLRRKKYYAKHMSLGVRIEQGSKVKLDTSFYRSCDNIILGREATKLWQQLIERHHPHRIKKVSITLDHLVENKNLQPELFDNVRKSHLVKQQGFENLSKAMDVINAKFGKDSIVMGNLPNQTQSFSGTKVAFTRIPELKEFYE